MRAAFAAAAILVLVPCSALAQSASPATAPPPTVTLPQVEVIGTSPLLGSGIDPDKMPSNVQSLDSGDIESTTKPSLTNALPQQIHRSASRCVVKGPGLGQAVHAAIDE